jgi:hypothetical protein
MDVESLLMIYNSGVGVNVLIRGSCRFFLTVPMLDVIVCRLGVMFWYLSQLQKESSLGVYLGIVFRVWCLVPVISLLEKKEVNLFLVSVFYHAHFPSYRKNPKQESNSGRIFVVVANLVVKANNFIPTPVFYHA